MSFFNGFGSRQLREMQDKAALADRGRELAKIQQRNEVHAILEAADGHKVSLLRRLLRRVRGEF